MKLLPRKGEMELSFSTQVEPSLISGKYWKSKKKVTEQKKASNFEETTNESLKSKKHLPISRSFTLSLTDIKSTENEPFLKVKKPRSSSFLKHQTTFQKVFKDSLWQEPLLDSFSCAIQKEILYHGRMYVTENFICFYYNILKEVKVSIDVSTVTVLKKANMALLVPNALSIRTNTGEKYFFTSLRARDTTFKVLKTVCSHLQDGSASSSPMVLTPDSSFENYKKPLNCSHSSLEQESIEQQDSDSNHKSNDVVDGAVLSESAGELKHWKHTGDAMGKEENETNRTADQNKGESWVSWVHKLKLYISQSELNSINFLITTYLIL
ncbi:GRAM domain-containing protein 2B [Latimeria chalumnae]|uniref:GRAM domain-containing protein 2B n=1 Tax=Latimeria chalumnae TaxID=7897 RepID=UPI00313E90F6